MVTPKMKFIRVKDDIDELKTELININKAAKQTYIDIRREKEGLGVPRKSKAADKSGKSAPKNAKLGLNANDESNADWGG